MAMVMGYSDAATRFTKGQSPAQIDRVLARSIQMVKELAGGQISMTTGQVQSIARTKRLSVDVDFINARLGFETPLQGMKLQIC